MAKRTFDPLVDGLDPVLNGLIAGLELPPDYTVSEWADAKRILTSDSSAEPGKWRTARAPYQREPMDVLTDPDVEIIVLKWASQLGKSEVINNILGFFIDLDPAPIMFVLPTLDIAKNYSAERVQPMIDACPELRGKIAEAKSRDGKSTYTEKSFAGGILVFSGSNSPASLSSRPIRVVLCDEIDKFAATIGKDGDPLRQAFQRTVNFWNRKKVLSSTPTQKGFSHIDNWYEKSDQRLFEVPCPDCDEFQFMRFFPDEKTGKGGVHWEDGKPESAEYHCEHCGTQWSQAQVFKAVKNGHWKAQKPFNGIAGFHINGLYSPWQTMAELAAEWDDCKDSPETEQTFINLKLGECFEISQRPKATAEELMDRSEDFGMQSIPMRVMLLTAGVDVQADRIEAQIVGWGSGEERWIISSHVLPGDPQTSVPWDLLDELLYKQYQHPGGEYIGVEACAVDTGYLTQTAMKYCHRQQAMGNLVYAIKGQGGEGTPIWRESEEKFKARMKLYLVGIHDAKMGIYGALVQDEPGEGYIHFSNTLNMEFYEQLIAEEIAVKKVGARYVREFQNPKRRRNEAFDTLVYATAARYSLQHIDYAERLSRLITRQNQQRYDPAEIGRMYAQTG
jgi:phage terminase large subunit GpA-like protein